MASISAFSLFIVIFSGVLPRLGHGTDHVEVCSGSGLTRGQADSQTACRLGPKLFNITAAEALSRTESSLLVSLDNVHMMRRSLRSLKPRRRTRSPDSPCEASPQISLPLVSRSFQSNEHLSLVQCPPLKVQPITAFICPRKHTGVTNNTCQQVYAPRMALVSHGESIGYQLVWIESGCSPQQSAPPLSLSSANKSWQLNNSAYYHPGVTTHVREAQSEGLNGPGLPAKQMDVFKTENSSRRYNQPVEYEHNADQADKKSPDLAVDSAFYRVDNAQESSPPTTLLVSADTRSTFPDAVRTSSDGEASSPSSDIREVVSDYSDSQISAQIYRDGMETSGASGNSFDPVRTRSTYELSGSFDEHLTNTEVISKMPRNVIAFWQRLSRSERAAILEMVKINTDSRAFSSSTSSPSDVPTAPFTAISPTGSHATSGPSDELSSDVSPIESNEVLTDSSDRLDNILPTTAALARSSEQPATPSSTQLSYLDNVQKYMRILHRHFNGIHPTSDTDAQQVTSMSSNARVFRNDEADPGSTPTPAVSETTSSTASAQQEGSSADPSTPAIVQMVYDAVTAAYQTESTDSTSQDRSQRLKESNFRKDYKRMSNRTGSIQSTVDMRTVRGRTSSENDAAVDLSISSDDWVSVRRVLAAFSLGSVACRANSTNGEANTAGIAATNTLLNSLLGDSNRKTLKRQLCQTQAAQIVREFLEKERQFMFEQHQKIQQTLLSHFQQNDQRFSSEMQELMSNFEGNAAPVSDTSKIGLRQKSSHSKMLNGSVQSNQSDIPLCLRIESDNSDNATRANLNCLIETSLNVASHIYQTFVPSFEDRSSALPRRSISLNQYIDVKTLLLMKRIELSAPLYHFALTNMIPYIESLEKVADYLGDSPVGRQNGISTVTEMRTSGDSSSTLDQIPVALASMSRAVLNLPGFSFGTVNITNHETASLPAIVDSCEANHTNYSVVIILNRTINRIFSVFRKLFNRLVRFALRVDIQLERNLRVLYIEQEALASVVEMRLSVLPESDRTDLHEQLEKLLNSKIDIDSISEDISRFIDQIHQLIQLLAGTRPDSSGAFSLFSVIRSVSSGLLRCVSSFVRSLHSLTPPTTMPTESTTASSADLSSPTSGSTASTTTPSIMTVSSTGTTSITGDTSILSTTTSSVTFDASSSTDSAGTSTSGPTSILPSTAGSSESSSEAGGSTSSELSTQQSSTVSTSSTSEVPSMTGETTASTGTESSVSTASAQTDNAVTSSFSDMQSSTVQSPAVNTADNPVTVADTRAPLSEVDMDGFEPIAPIIPPNDFAVLDNILDF